MRSGCHSNTLPQWYNNTYALSCQILTAPIFEREKVPPAMSEGGIFPFSPSSCSLFNSRAISMMDLFWENEMIPHHNVYIMTDMQVNSDKWSHFREITILAEMIPPI